MQLLTMELQNEVSLQEQAIEAQKNRNELLLSHYEEIRKQRHDMCHHLRTVSDLLERGKTEKEESERTEIISFRARAPEEVWGFAPSAPLPSVTGDLRSFVKRRVSFSQKCA